MMLSAGGVIACRLMLALAVLAGSPGKTQVTVPTTSGQALQLNKQTEVKLMVLRELRSDHVAAGDRVALRVDEPVLVQGIVVIPVGATAWAEVVELDKAGGFGTTGRLGLKLDRIDIPGGSIKIAGGRSMGVDEHGGELATELLLLGPLALFAPGRDAKLKAGDLIYAHTVEDMQFQRPQ